MDHSAYMKMMAQAKRQAEVSERGKDAMSGQDQQDQMKRP